MAPRSIPRKTFWLSGCLALVALVPALSFALSAALELDTELIIVAPFTALPAFVTGGGIGRGIALTLAAREPEPPGFVRSVLHALLPTALAGAALAIGRR